MRLSPTQTEGGYAGGKVHLDLATCFVQWRQDLKRQSILPVSTTRNYTIS